MKIQATIKDKLPNADVLVLPIFMKSGLGQFGKAIDKKLDGTLSAVMKEEEFEAKGGESLKVRDAGKAGFKKVILLGIGGKPFTPTMARKSGARLVQAARAAGAKTVVVAMSDVLTGNWPVFMRAFSEGALLGDYRFHKYQADIHKKHAEGKIEALTVLVPTKKDIVAAEKGIAIGQTYAQATIMARELVNEPASHMTPARLVEAAKQIADKHPKRINLEVHDQRELEKMKMGGLLAVAQGSDHPPYLIHLTYKPSKKAKKRVAIVGKGITFDSGGLSLKPAKSMEDMKIDMAGAAAVLGAFSALVELAPDVEVHGIAGVCENMPSGTAFRPGDIVTPMSGKTIEVLNTDAEGRVTLADTLYYGSLLKPDFMIDLATLTGACMVALGQEVAGLMGNSQPLAKKILDAAEEEGELLWQLPLPEEYKPNIKSKVADLKNIGNSWGGALTAGLFLQEYVGSTPWVHLDIAGPAWAEAETVPHQPLGATGFGVRTLLRFLENL